MMKFRNILVVMAAVLGLAPLGTALAQTTTQFSEDFTGRINSTANGWLVFGGACLTAGTTPVTQTTAASPTSVSYPTPVPATNPQYIYGCVIDDANDILHYYYQQQHIDYGTTQSSDQFLVGGSNGYLGSGMSPGSSLQSPDSAPATGPGSGALRFTNGYSGGSNSGRGERGAIISANAYAFNQGIQVTFKTVTYGGDNGQGTGADGISFYLLDGCMPVAGAIIPANCLPNVAYGTTAANLTAGNTFPATGAFPPVGSQGGSLSYTCSNQNSPYDGLAGAYLGLGIDEYGNFVNPGDNTNTGPGASPSTIGLRGAGGISWQALTNAYGVNPGTSSAPYKPYYPASLATSCSSGTYDSVTNTCGVCSSGTYGSGVCTTTTAACPVGSTLSTIPPTTGAPCAVCPAGQTYHANTGTGGFTNGYCKTPGAGNPESSPTGWDAETTVFNPTSTSAPNSSAAQAAVEKTCQNGTLYNYATASSPQAAGATTLSTAHGGNTYNTANILDYAEIAYQKLTGPVAISNQENTAAPTRALANTLLYNLKITPDGLLSLSYSANGGAYQSIIKNQNVTAANGPLPVAVRYGFAASSGGSSNAHEVMCFKSQPVNQAQSSAGVNQRQSAEIQPTGSFAYFSFYDTLDWAGRLTANALQIQSNGSLTVNQTPTWDGSCVLSGSSAPSCSAYTAMAEAPSSRVILSYGSVASGSSTVAEGVPFEAPGTGGGISTAQLANLDLGDSSSTNAYRLNYLRGDRTNELGNSSPPCPIYSASAPTVACFRPRDSVLGDIIDSSPVWVGPPQYPYTANWKDKINTSASLPENSGTQNYLTYQSTMQTRTNVVYVGADDGMLHGFRTGSFTSSGTFDTSSSAAPNDGEEVLAYVPGTTLQSAPSPGSAGCPTPIPNPMAATLSTGQNIHGVTPAVTSGSTTVAACVAPSLDYSNQNYGHNFFVDATPGTGDLFYAGEWHTWVVGGMGPGGAAIYALDVTNSGNIPTATPLPSNYYSFSESNASRLVIGEWTPATLTCQNITAPNAATCGNNLGNTYGTPIIRRLHDGNWAILFGNGFGSASGDAGIYVMVLSYSSPTASNPSGITPTTYYLSTSTQGQSNGIAYVTSADLDGDHITDYVYAGDLKGNVWRFDLTGASEGSWAVTPGALFKTPAGQPITTAVTVASGSTSAGANTLMVGFGTGQKTQVTNLAAISYTGSQQALYGVWDSNMGEWNAKSATQYASLTTASTSVPAPPYSSTLVYTQLEQQSLNPVNLAAYTVGSTNYGEVSESAANPVCWAGTSACASTPEYGWYLNLPNSNSTTVGSTTTTTYEQIVYNPLVLGTAFVVNSTVPAINSTLQCTTNTDTGFTYAVSVLSGNYVPNFFTYGATINYHDASAIAEQTNATGTSFPVTTANGQNWLVYQTVSNTPSTLQVNPGANYVGKRLTWVQLR